MGANRILHNNKNKYLNKEKEKNHTPFPHFLIQLSYEKRKNGVNKNYAQLLRSIIFIYTMLEKWFFSAWRHRHTIRLSRMSLIMIGPPV